MLRTIISGGALCNLRRTDTQTHACIYDIVHSYMNMLHFLKASLYPFCNELILIKYKRNKDSRKRIS